jgi:streptogramin lyase
MIGRLMPKTGDIKLVHVPTANALPYGIAVNTNGVPFFAEFGTNKLASIDPKTMEIHEYPLPDAGSRPRRTAITSDGAVKCAGKNTSKLSELTPAAHHRYIMKHLEQVTRARLIAC